MVCMDNLSLNAGLQVFYQIQITSKMLPKHLRLLSQGLQHFPFKLGSHNN